MQKSVLLVILVLLLLNFPILIYADSPISDSVASPYIQEQKISLTFQEPEISKKEGYDFLKIDNCSYTSTPGYPMLPMKTLSFSLPEDSKIEKLQVIARANSLSGNFTIIPVPFPLSSDSTGQILVPSDEIYESASIYPETDYVYHEANGLSSETQERAKILTVNIFPIKYLPAEKQLLFSQEITVVINYVVPPKAMEASDSVKNLIITSSAFESIAMNLAQWKNSTGLYSLVLNTTWIYSNYAGIDNPERIRNCIKEYFSNYDILYVTIFGDVDQVPIRYAYVNETTQDESFIPTDLYYADLDGNWDDNHDGIFADQKNDIIDGLPDVYVGRIPVSLEEYAQAAVDKIIGYQQQVIYNPSPDDWTQRFILSAATCSPNGFSDLDAEGFAILKDYIANYVADKNIIKLYEKYDNLSTSLMHSQLNKGALFLNFAGHGDPGTGLLSAGWLFYWGPLGLWWNGFGISDAQSLTNGYKLPFVAAMSCSTARLDDTDCLGEWFVANPDGGAIAYLGATRKAYGYFDELAPYYYMGAMDSYIYLTYAEGKTKTGELWAESIKKYRQWQIWNYQTTSKYHAKTLMETILLGDPTIDVSGDLTPPITTVNYDNEWHTEDFTVALAATDIGRGVEETYYRINNGSIKQVGVDGQPIISDEGANNYVEYWSVDQVGNEEVPHKIFTNIKLDKSNPYGNIVINESENYTSSETVTLSLQSTDFFSGINQIRLSNDGVWDTEQWEDAVSTKSWNLTSDEGLKTVHYQVRDNAGNTAIFSDSIILDTSAPIGSVVIDEADVTNSTSVTLTLSAEDAGSGVAEMCFSNDNVTWSSWETYATPKNWTLADGFGLKTVFVQFKNGAGLNSSSYSDSIELVEDLSFNITVDDSDFVVSTVSNSSVSNLTFNQDLKRLRLRVDGDTGTTGFCNVTVPAELMSGDFTLYLDDITLVEGADYTQTNNGTHYLLNVNYTHSSHILELFSTEVVPDFAAWLFLPFLMSATLLGLTLRRKLKKQ